jgi:hypothetical protein
MADNKKVLITSKQKIDEFYEENGDQQFRDMIDNLAKHMELSNCHDARVEFVSGSSLRLLIEAITSMGKKVKAKNIEYALNYHRPCVEGLMTPIDAKKLLKNISDSDVVIITMPNREDFPKNIKFALEKVEKAYVSGKDALDEFGDISVGGVVLFDGKMKQLEKHPIERLGILRTYFYQTQPEIQAVDVQIISKKIADTTFYKRVVGYFK